MACGPKRHRPIPDASSRGSTPLGLKALIILAILENDTEWTNSLPAGLQTWTENARGVFDRYWEYYSGNKDFPLGFMPACHQAAATFVNIRPSAPDIYVFEELRLRKRRR